MSEKNRESRIGAVILMISAAVFIVTSAVAVPILARPFYHAHIQPLDLTERSGMTESQIKETYDDVLDYCTGKTDEFSAGSLPWSEDGRAHFEDVRKLFILDLVLALISAVITAVVVIYCLVKRKKPYFFRGHSPGFWSSVVIGITMAVVAIVSAVNFDKAFEVFHRIFFPGKDNWILDAYTDPVILLMPQEFFAGCAILIVAIIIVLCGALLALDRGILYRSRRESGKNVYQK